MRIKIRDNLLKGWQTFILCAIGVTNLKKVAWGWLRVKLSLLPSDSIFYLGVKWLAWVKTFKLWFALTQPFRPIFFWYRFILTQIELFAWPPFGCVLMYGVYMWATTLVFFSAHCRSVGHYIVSVLIFSILFELSLVRFKTESIASLDYLPCVWKTLYERS